MMQVYFGFSALCHGSTFVNYLGMHDYLLKKKTKTRTQPEPGFGSTEGKAVSISLFATNRLWVVNVFTLMWNSFLQAADSCMQKRSLGAV